ncbi:hypothetical protein [Natronococcus roseus]|uniref:hypothetical protein n=1 Tax=Natronococcus roseus TaxID=1052014 RepID=UPI00374CCD9D
MRRRSVIKSISGVGTLAITGTVSGNEGKDPVERLSKRIAKARVNDNDDRAKQLLEAHGVEEYKFNSIDVYDEPDDEMGIEHAFRKGTFDLYLYGLSNSSDHYMFQAIMTMDSGYEGMFRAADRVDDIIGITWNTDHWSLGNITEYNPPMTYMFGDGDKWHDISIDGYDPNKSGVTGAVDIMGGEIPPSGRRDEVYQDEVSFALEGYVQALDDAKPPLFCEYFHNISQPYKGSISNITVGVSSKGIGINVDFTSGASTRWEGEGYTEYEG